MKWMKSIMTTGEIPMSTSYEEVDPEVFVKKEGKTSRDKLNDDLSLIITCSNNIGLIFESLGDLPQALVNFERVYKISTRVEDVLGKAIQLCNIGRVFEQEEKFVKAIHFFKESYATFSQINLGRLHIHLKEEVKSHIKRVSKIIYQ